MNLSEHAEDYGKLVESTFVAIRVRALKMSTLIRKFIRWLLGSNKRERLRGWMKGQMERSRMIQRQKRFLHRLKHRFSPKPTHHTPKELSRQEHVMRALKAYRN